MFRLRARARSPDTIAVFRHLTWATFFKIDTDASRTWSCFGVSRIFGQNDKEVHDTLKRVGLKPTPHGAGRDPEGLGRAAIPELSKRPCCVEQEGAADELASAKANSST